jgi:hypothetical protein
VLGGSAAMDDVAQFSNRWLTLAARHQAALQVAREGVAHRRTNVGSRPTMTRPISAMLNRVKAGRKLDHLGRLKKGPPIVKFG